MAIINGPNLNMLGLREPHIYGNETLEEIKAFTDLEIKNNNLNVELSWFQSNIEGEIVSLIQRLSGEGLAALIINPGGYSHTSVAILDALMLIKAPIVEVHLSNTHRREEFRHTKLTARASTIVMEGLGKLSYITAIRSQLY